MILCWLKTLRFSLLLIFCCAYHHTLMPAEKKRNIIEQQEDEYHRVCFGSHPYEIEPHEHRPERCFAHSDGHPWTYRDRMLAAALSACPLAHITYNDSEPLPFMNIVLGYCINFWAKWTVAESILAEGPIARLTVRPKEPKDEKYFVNFHRSNVGLMHHPAICTSSQSICEIDTHFSLKDLSELHDKRYAIASQCGRFRIVPLNNSRRFEIGYRLPTVQDIVKLIKESIEKK